MKILHTADWHLGQILYQDYDRIDEHEHFIQQLEHWCRIENPDAVLVSGDIFDIQMPSAAAKERFVKWVLRIKDSCKDMQVVITAGNHDSASRLQAESEVWKRSGVTVIGSGPATELLSAKDGTWEDHYVVELTSGYIVALPYMSGNRKGLLQHLLDYVAEHNTEGKPVVMMGHLPVNGMDSTGHHFVGKVDSVSVSDMGNGFDYLALGHIHRPQTIGSNNDINAERGCEESIYPSPVIRYSGSALHVDADENYPHSISIVEMEHHGGDVRVKRMRINEKLHFYDLPKDGEFKSTGEVLDGVKRFATETKAGYFRIKVDYAVNLPSDINEQIRKVIGDNDMVRFNPKIHWEGEPEKTELSQKTKFQVAEIQQMKDPLEFVKKTIEQYKNLDRSTLDNDFAMIKKEIEDERKRIEEAETKKTKQKKAKEEIASEMPSEEDNLTENNHIANRKHQKHED